MKPPALPVFTLESFPQGPARRQWYVEQLARHVANFPGISQPHAHNFYLLLYVTQGYGTHTIDLVSYNLQPGSLFFMTPGQVHHWQLSADAEGYVVLFEPDFYLLRYPGNRLFEYPFFQHAHPPVLYLPPNETEIQFLMERMWMEHVTPAPQQDEVFRSYLHLCLELAARHFPTAPAPAPDEPRHAQQVLREFGASINQQFRVHREVQYYADQLHVSPNHLNALCRRQLGKTASSFIQERVMMEARRLLRHTDATVAQIADTLGFEDASYFSRYFRKHTGLTAEVFRATA
ncbi:helix-turn-helix domain-containing protein [Hymenobacter sp. BT186]|uniref:Helix-turn-helix domain-containing protein n=1 Tax=Hymenobacter telluris TaxID=2816474 RepID=A0A939EX88_9BACT|nr:helix-turn-helix transcriptional regulator [Hymenobacter telluris]MBO0358849.1 helix-turn-helix domain-containing protein [Hymenobacter telluris]MBW3374875.1 AraC family transcriptional regulator [Hymenobacter norwichensis]